MLKIIVFLIESFGSSFVFWLGLFICTRSIASPLLGAKRTNLWLNPPLMAGSAITLLAFFLFGVAMQTIAETPQHFLIWQRLTWWTIPIAMYGFCWATISLYYRQQVTQSVWRWLVRLSWLLALYALCLVIAILTGILVQGEKIQVMQSAFASYRTPSRMPWYLFYALYLLGMLLSTVAILLIQNLWIVRTTPQEYQKIKWLLYGSGVALLGMVIGVVIQPLSGGAVPVQLGMFLIVTGVGIVGYGIVNHNTIMQEQVLKQDFQHSLLSSVLTAALYLLAMAFFAWMGYPLPTLLTPILLFLAVLTQAPLGWEEAVSDRLLLPRWAVGYRERLVLLRRSVLTTPEPKRVLDKAEIAIQQIVEESRLNELQHMITEEIERIFYYNHFHDDTLLGESPLQNLQWVLAQTTHLSRNHAHSITAQKAFALRTLLTTQIEHNLEPDSMGLPSTDHNLQIGYLILQKKHLQGKSRTEVETAIRVQHNVIVTGGAYARHLQSARQHLAQWLFASELEQRKG